MKLAAVFGGGQKEDQSKEYLDTIEIGKMLGKHNYSVKSGGYYGIMEAVSKGIIQEDGEAIGYTCKKFPSTHGNNYLTETVVCDDIYERLRNLVEDTDIFIIQRGGIGTLSELFLTLDQVRKMRQHKPRVILVGTHWHSIIDAVSVCFKHGERDLVTILDDYKLIEKYL